VSRIWPHVDALHADLHKLLDADLPALAQPATLVQCLQAHAEQEQALRAGWPQHVQALRDWLEAHLRSTRPTGTGASSRSVAVPPGWTRCDCGWTATVAAAGVA
jgi:hypothetical protein